MFYICRYNAAVLAFDLFYIYSYFTIFTALDNDIIILKNLHLSFNYQNQKMQEIALQQNENDMT